MALSLDSLSGLTKEERKYYEGILRRAYNSVHKQVIMSVAFQLRATDLGLQATKSLPQMEIDRLESLEAQLRGTTTLLEEPLEVAHWRILCKLDKLKNSIETTHEDHHLTKNFAKLVYAMERALRTAHGFQLTQPQVESAKLVLRALRLRGYSWNPKGHSKLLQWEGGCQDAYPICGKLPGHILSSGFETKRRYH